MSPEKSAALTKALQQQVSLIAADLREQYQEEGPVQERARALHQEEKVGEEFLLWTELLSRRAAVLWVLKTVYVRVLEDRGLARPRRLVDPQTSQLESEALFLRLAPHLGASAYLSWAFRDLGKEGAGLPELFAPQPAEVAQPSDSVSQRLLDFWRERDANTGELLWRFDDESFDGRLMGDLYQDLDPVVKSRYALLQTPDFILDFILDRTLTPAIEKWGVETVRVLDPACGSGHFLLAAFKRLVAGMREKFPERSREEIVADCLERVVGIDLNDYACALARARLVMTALELSGAQELALGSALRPQVYWSDALEQVEKEIVGNRELFEEFKEKPRASLTRPEVATRLKPLLSAKFHVVVGNPPYITERNPKQREYHREKVGKGRRYVSAAGKYSLGAPFTERMFQLALDGGWVGQITANSFMKREFGKALIQEVLPKEDLLLVVDTSGAHIPDHGTPTVLLFGRRRQPTGSEVLVVMGKRGEPGVPVDPAVGKVWSSILEGSERPGYESEFVSTATVERGVLNKHPWSIGGGGAAEFKALIESKSFATVEAIAASVGVMAVTGEDDVYVGSRDQLSRRGHDQAEALRPFVVGDQVRDWRIDSAYALFPHNQLTGDLFTIPAAEPWFWKYRARLASRIYFGKTHSERGLDWREYGIVVKDKLHTPLSITFAFVATHNHFALDRGRKVFNRTAPVIKLPAGSSEEEHLALLGQLNSSTACFWMKQVFHDKGNGGVGGGIASEEWERFFEFDGTKLKTVPLATTKHEGLVAFAAALTGLAEVRNEDSVSGTVASSANNGPAALRAALADRRVRDLGRLYQMVGLQEELDWLNYQLYGLAEGARIRAPEELTSLVPGQRPFELILASQDAERREALARGEEPDEAPTEWFTRHGWEPVNGLEQIENEAERALIAERIALIQSNRNLALIENFTHKRRWYRPNYQAEEQEALRLFLADRIEDWSRQRASPFTARQLVVGLQDDTAVNAVGEVLAGRPDFDLERMLGEILNAESVPNIKHHLFKPAGLEKRQIWEQTWDLQHQEDAGQKVTIPVPPKYKSSDFLKPSYWKLRGGLDVPKERFIAFSEVPNRDASELLYGWAGWTPSQRATALLGLDERSEEEGATFEERIGLLYGAWFQIPYVRWEDPALASEIESIIVSLVGPQGVTDAMLDGWAERFTVAKPKRGRKRSA